MIKETTSEIVDETENRRSLIKIEQGIGELVVLFHGAASHSGQWRSLIQRLTPRYRVVTFDQYGYRDSPCWEGDHPMLMSDQVAPVLEYLTACSEPFHLVGHSHGASLAALCASQLIDRVKSLALYEPNTFGALDLTDPDQRAQHDQIKVRFGAINERMSTHDQRALFAEDLLDFWLGDGAWSQLSSRLQTQLISMMEPAAREVYAALYSPFAPEALRPLRARVLLMSDPHTPAAARLITERYQALLPDCITIQFPHCGHLAPVFYPDQVNAVIERHLDHNSRES